MDTEIGPCPGQGQALSAADRDVLIAIIAQLQATVLEQQRVIKRLERRIAELEGQAKPGGPPRMPGLKAKSGRQPPVKQLPRKQRRHGFARRRMTPTQRVEHVMENCPDCGTHLTGGWTQRTREVIELPVAPVQVTEHVYIARTCPACRRRCTPPAGLDGVVLGRQRLGVNLLSLVATLREEARMPFRTIQRYLDTVHQLRVSEGAIVGAIRQTAQKAQPMVAGILDRIRASPVVHADETGWRQSGANGYVWTFSTPTERYFLRRGRGKTVVDEALSDAFSGVLVSDCYAAYHHYDGPKPPSGAGPTCCGTSTTSAPSTPMLRHWPGEPTPSTGFTTGPKPALIPRPSGGAPPNWPWNDNCWPSANPSGTTRRQPRPSCADASSATSGDSLSLWPNRTCQRTTTPPSAACATWSSVARSAAASARSKAHRAR